MNRRTFLLSAGGVAGVSLGGYGMLDHHNKQETPTQFALPRTLELASDLRIHAIQTGYVAVKKAHHTLRGPALSRMLAIALDRRWTPWLPIYAWVIEHPEGVIVVDTGETAQVSDPAYFACDPGNAFFYERFLQFAVPEETMIAAQLQTLGLEAQDVRWIILTHLHSDHAGGLYAFPRAEIMVAQAEYEQAMRQPRGALPCRWPPWFAPAPVVYQPRALGPFSDHQTVTQAGDVHILPTPGHSTGHQSVLLQHEDISYCFAGDASFSAHQVERQIVAGICADVRAARQTLRRLRDFMKTYPTVYLPSHDPEAADRLITQTVTNIGDE